MPYDAQFKMLYSPTGLYVLMNGTDKKLTAAMNEDFMDLWNEDVFEFFFWTDERIRCISSTRSRRSARSCRSWCPTSAEVPRLATLALRGGPARSRKATTVGGGKKTTGAAIEGWTAEVFVPYKLLEPLRNVPPKPGTRWRANFYRVDYDDGQPTSWDWVARGPQLSRDSEIRHAGVRLIAFS